MADAGMHRYSGSCVAMSHASLRLRPPTDDVSTLGAGDGAQSLLILTCVDGALRDSAIGSCAAATETIRALASRGVAVVLTSYHAVDELLALQKDVGVTLPFIAANGRSLHIPRGYFGRPPRAATRRIGPWDVIEFTPPSLEDAVDVLLGGGGTDRGAPAPVGV